MQNLLLFMRKIYLLAKLQKIGKINTQQPMTKLTTKLFKLLGKLRDYGNGYSIKLKGF